MNELKSNILVIVFVVIVIYSLSALHDERAKYPSFLSPEDRKVTLSIYESRGFDGIRCVKLPYSNKKYKNVITKLQLKGIIKHPSHETHEANCTSVKWWDINFPKDANNFKIEDNGNIRILTAFKNGYIYYAYELR